MNNRSRKFIFGISIICLVIIVSIVFVQRGAISAFEYNLPYVKLSDQLKSQILHANLWAEQVKKVDNTLNFERDVVAPLSETKGLLESMYSGGKTALGSFEESDDEKAQAL